jgi:hypothetical protein
MSISRPRGYVKAAAIFASVLITAVLFRSVVLFSGADQFPGQNIFPIIRS